MQSIDLSNMSKVDGFYSLLDLPIFRWLLFLIDGLTLHDLYLMLIVIVYSLVYLMPMSVVHS